MSLSVAGDGLSWYNWQMNRDSFNDWNLFKVKLLARFGKSKIRSPSQRLFVLRQTDSIDEFVHDFEDLSSQVLGLDYEKLEGIFMNGLKLEL